MKFNIPYKNGNEIKYIAEVMGNNRLQANGLFSEKIKRFFLDKYKMQNIHLVHSCTTALEIAAQLIDIKEGDEVIMPSYTYVSTANAFVLKGAKIIFVDVDKSLNIDMDVIEKSITHKTKAIVAVHYGGISCDMDKLMALASKYKLYVIEDAAQSINAKYKESYLGSIGHIGCISFHETKNIHCGEGGVLIINDQTLIEKAATYVEKGTNRSDFLLGKIEKYTWQAVGSSPLMSELEAGFLFAQLEDIDKVTEKRCEIAKIYNDELNNLEKMIIPNFNSGNGHCFYILCKDTAERLKLKTYLKSNDIESATHYEPLHNSAAGKLYGNFKGVDRYTSSYAGKILRLPLHTEIEPREAYKICNKIKDFYKPKTTDNLLITGGAGFIGSNFVEYIFEYYKNTYQHIIILDKLTYAGSSENIETFLGDNIIFYEGNICDTDITSMIMEKYKINRVINFAAESHVDKSIQSTDAFVETNVVGVMKLMDVSKKYWTDNKCSNCRFIQMSTDEVYGSSRLIDETSFTEDTSLNPQNPYAATKASAELLINAYINTFNYPAIIVRSSNNYGLNQNKEKLIPKVMDSLKNNSDIELYGKGVNERNWIHVLDNCRGLYQVLIYGKIKEIYNISGRQSISNNRITNMLIDLYNLHSESQYTGSIKYITDRLGHDLCYKIDDSKIRTTLGFNSEISLELGLESLVKSLINKCSKN